jgi:hypothetical protein
MPFDVNHVSVVYHVFGVDPVFGVKHAIQS